MITDPSEPIKNETGGIRVIRGEFWGLAVAFWVNLGLDLGGRNCLWRDKGEFCPDVVTSTAGEGAVLLIRGRSSSSVSETTLLFSLGASALRF